MALNGIVEIANVLLKSILENASGVGVKVLDSTVDKVFVDTTEVGDSEVCWTSR